MSELNAEIEVSNVPTIVHKGVYTLWEKPDGSLRIQYLRSDQTEESFIELPGPIVKMAKAASEGKMNPMDMMKEMMRLAGSFGRQK
jgi:hypothetical protein